MLAVNLRANCHTGFNSKLFSIFCLILGTSDSCVTQGEESIFEYQDKHDLITLGWVSCNLCDVIWVTCNLCDVISL